MKTALPVIAVLSLALSGCGRHETASTGSASMATTTASRSRGTPPGTLPWIDDDWSRAVTAGRAEHKPIVVDLWATWCSYCTAMEATTLRSLEVIALRDRFVWARIDTDKPENGDLLARLTQQGLPDYLVLDPVDESIVGESGTALPEQFRNMLRDADRVYQAAHATALAAGDSLRLVVEGVRAARKADHAAAADLFRRAIAAAPDSWDRRDETIDGEVNELIDAGRVHDGIDVALDIPETDHSNEAADAIATAADDLDSLSKDAKDRGALTQRLFDRMLAMATDTAAPIGSDVRVELWGEIGGIYDARGEKTKRRDVREKILAILDAAAKQAPDPLSASAYNETRTAELIDLGRPQEAIAILQQSEKDLPTQPDPPYRLALIYEGLHRDAEAIAELDKAIAHAPKKFAIELSYERATFQHKAGHDADACAAARTFVADEKTLPASERMPTVVERARHLLMSACAGS